MTRKVLCIAALGVALFVAGCGNDENQGWLGYAEGEDAFIAAPQAGWVQNIHVHRGDLVKKGDLLFTLDDTNQVAQRDAAAATISQTTAQMDDAHAALALATKELQRQQKLVAANAGAQQALDLARNAYQSAKARVDQIEAQTHQASANLDAAAYQLSQRAVVAQISGRVEDIYYRNGEYAQSGAPVLSILPPQNVFVRFFVPEGEFAKVKMGQDVTITCDACAKNVRAKITFIAQQEEFTPPVIFSVGNREKLVFKLEARSPGGLKLNPGQPVEVHPANPNSTAP